MIIFKPNKLIFISILAAISIISYNTTWVIAQTNETQGQDKVNYENFHSNIQQIVGHIEMAELNKNNGNYSLALAHTLHPIEEVLSLVAIPLNNTDSNLNNTYANNLVSLSTSASSGNSTSQEFSSEAKNSIALSNTVLTRIVPTEILNDTNHNITVIQDLLTTVDEEYSEGVQDGNIVMMLEYQDGSAFLNRAYDIFNKTKSILNEREEITLLFNNLTNSVEQRENPTKINLIVKEINHKLSESSTIPSMIESGSEDSTQDYISNIRLLLNQTIDAYSTNDTIKAKELATTAYLDNFEHIEDPIGEELSEEGEELLREQLSAQIDSNASLEAIQQTVNATNKVLDEAEESITS